MADREKTGGRGRLRAGVWALSGALVLSCAYPRKSTPLSAVGTLHTEPEGAPDELWRLAVVSAEIPREKRSGLAWDEGETEAPDPYVRLVVGGRVLWQTDAVDDTIHPTFDASPPRNLAVDRGGKIRLELWDDDGVSGDPIGIYEGRILGEAIVGADTILKLEGGATLTVRVEPPAPHRGVGVALYEVRKDALRVLEVTPRSPAARAGIKAGDRIVAIGGRTVEELGPTKAESSLVLAAQNQSELMVDTAGRVRGVVLDRGFVWLSL